MIIGISGAHRSGKSTLARAVAERFGYQYIETSTSAVAKAAGFDAVADLSLIDRLRLQQIILENHEQVISSVRTVAITDRTPLDMMAYMLCEIRMNSLDVAYLPEFNKCVKEYIQKGFDVYRQRYSMCFITRPLTTYAVDPTKPPHNTGYQDHFQYTLEGLLWRSTELETFPFARIIDNSDHNARMAVIDQSIGHALGGIISERTHVLQ